MARFNNSSFSSGDGKLTVAGSFLPKAAAAPAIRDGEGFTVVRTGVGTYYAQFSDPKITKMVAASASVRVAASTVGTKVVVGDWDAANKRLYFYTQALQKGFHQFPLAGFREIGSNVIQNLAAVGGILASDSDPALARVSAATDKALRVVWDTTNDTDEVAIGEWVKPPDFDSASAVTVHLYAAMSGDTDTPTVDVQMFDGIGDTEAGAATGAITGETIAEYSATIAAAGLAAHPGVLSFSLVPAAHENNSLYVYGCWLEYNKLANLVDLAADADNAVDFQVVLG